MLLIEKQDCD